MQSAATEGQNLKVRCNICQFTKDKIKMLHVYDWHILTVGQIAGTRQYLLHTTQARQQRVGEFLKTWVG